MSKVSVERPEHLRQCALPVAAQRLMEELAGSTQSHLTVTMLGVLMPSVQVVEVLTLRTSGWYFQAKSYIGSVSSPKPSITAVLNDCQSAHVLDQSGQHLSIRWIGLRLHGARRPTLDYLTG